MPHLRLKNFKCFEDQSIPLGDLTVFCGNNGTGKSSAIQGLLLFQAALDCLRRGVRDLSLNSVSGLALGTLNDILPRSITSSDKKTDRISIEYCTTNSKKTISFDNSKVAETANYVHISGNSLTKGDHDPWKFLFLSAERIGPRASQEKLSNSADSDLRLGEHGEHLAEVLARFERRRIRKELVHPNEKSKGKLTNDLLLRNTELWMSELFGPLQVRSQSNGPYAPPSLQIRDATNRDADWLIPTNYGFGVTYCLPVVVGCLLVTKGGLIIVDSPEAHLHPSAQTKVGKFLGWVASSGSSVIVETHSDHVVDGIRLGIAEKIWPLQSTNCLFIDFEKDMDGNIQVQPIKANDDGSLERWPRGFFDQQTINLRALAQYKHGRRA